MKKNQNTAEKDFTVNFRKSILMILIESTEKKYK